MNQSIDAIVKYHVFGGLFAIRTPCNPGIDEFYYLLPLGVKVNSRKIIVNDNLSK